jgi:hypothetical protein
MDVSIIGINYFTVYYFTVVASHTGNYSWFRSLVGEANVFFDHDQDRGPFYSFFKSKKQFPGGKLKYSLKDILLFCCEGFQIRKKVYALKVDGNEKRGGSGRRQ